MSDRARAERQSFDELQLLVGLLAEELAAFRVRALGAEQKLRQMTKEAASPSLFDAGTLQEKLGALEAENGEMRERRPARRIARGACWTECASCGSKLLQQKLQL